ncbi:DUF1641 domain-containing protein [Salibacterium salarium]|uniref:DUF1641 domain-containing protein n=1 Tax=Salibacterium salarium TaxID=284579 RepID=A0A3R9P3C5_9BACI|nr:DUF1641 domain-containing protein [Salibacterium salarium]RSL30186.1 DUF1641 domain-containing protein [Salibacterium salarium]
MGKAIETIKKMETNEEEERSRDLREIEDTLIENKEVILQTIDILHHAHEKGLLSLLNGTLSEGDQVLHVLVEAINKPENTNTIRNMLLMMGTLGMIDFKQLEPILLKVNAGMSRVAENSETEQKTGYLDLAKSLKDPEVNRAITLILNFLKGMGQETDEEKEDREESSDQKV